MKDLIFCEQCEYSRLRIHDPKRIGEEIYQPHYICCRQTMTFADGINEKVDADDFCSLGKMCEGLPKRDEQKKVVEE